MPRASPSGASDEETPLPGQGSPGTRMPGTDGTTVEDLIRQLKMERLIRSNNNYFGAKKEEQFSSQEVRPNI